MVRNQDDDSFVTWEATLHPEAVSLTSSTDPRVETTATTSAWATIYSETFGGNDDNIENVPIAIQVVPLDEQDQPPEETSPHHHYNDCNDPEIQLPEQDIDGTNGNVSHNTMATTSRGRPQPWKHSNLIDLILGFSLTLGSFLATIKIEIAAIIVYTLAAGFYFLSEEVFASTPLLLAKSICLTVTAALMIADAVLLTVSVIVTETLGGIAFFLCTLFGGPTSGTQWHQFIRRACHMTRWGFRSCHKDWKPERVFPIPMEAETQFNEQQQQHLDCPEEHDGHQEDTCLPLYRDDIPPPHSPAAENVTFSADDVSTLTDTARYTDSCRGDPPPPQPCSTAAPPEATVVAMVDPENVHILDQEEEVNCSDQHFVKNTQKVVIT